MRNAIIRDINMPVARIERIIGGRVIGHALVNTRTGKYHCHHHGSNVSPVQFDSLDEVANFLRTNPGSGVRMTPGFRKIVKNIYIDGIAR